MGERRGLHKVLVRKREGKNHLEDKDVDGRIILRWIFIKWNEHMQWNDLAQNRDRRRALVNAVLNLQVP
jgi:hypothetical protein